MKAAAREPGALRGLARLAVRRRRTLLRRLGGAALMGCAGGALGVALAQGSFGGGAVPVGPQPRSVDEWLVRLQQASSVPAFVGTFVVTASSGAMASARIWHLCEANNQFERIDALSGPPRSSFRRNDEVSLVLPEAHVVRTEQREPGGRFPNLLRPGADQAAAAFYTAREEGPDRVAGQETDIVRLKPVDALRYGYRIWSERRTGLVLKMQTLDDGGKVLEQSAFSEVQINPPQPLVQAQLKMTGIEGYRSERIERQRTDAAQEGWRLQQGVPGFEPQGCWRRQMTAAGPTLQWVFSDGLATVSMFIEPFDAKRHVRQGVSTLGATHAMSHRWPDARGTWWVTLIGEVPLPTLQRLLDNLRHDK